MNHGFENGVHPASEAGEPGPREAPLGLDKGHAPEFLGFELAVQGGVAGVEALGAVLEVYQ